MVENSVINTGTAYGSDEYYKAIAMLPAVYTDMQEKKGINVVVDKVEVPYTTRIARRVLKIWDDGGSQNVEHPAVTVQLMKNGVDCGAPVTLNDANNWRHDFGQLDAYEEDGTPIRWIIREITPIGDNFTVSIAQRGITFVITNKYEAPATPLDPNDIPTPPTPSEPDIPIPTPPDNIEDPDVPL